MLLWVTYSSRAGLSAKDSRKYAVAFNRLHQEAEPGLAWIAVQALQRLGLEPEGQRASSAGATSPRATSPPPVERRTSSFGPPPSSASASAGKAPAKQASSKDWKSADAAVKKGLKLHRKKKYKPALAQYDKALARVPVHTKALYNAAGALALLDRIPEAVERLRAMRATDTEDGYARLAKARGDRDFESARTNADFKEVTGYAKVIILNSLGEYGEEEVERIQEYVEGAGYPVADVLADRLENRPSPIIWHQPGVAKSTAYILSKLVNHPKTMLVPIDWETDVDIAISWGDTIQVDPKTGRPKVKSYEMEDPEAAAKDARTSQNRALREPEKFATEVEHHARTPERLGGEVEGSVKRAERTKDKLESTGKTLEKLGGLGQ